MHEGRGKGGTEFDQKSLVTPSLVSAGFWASFRFRLVSIVLAWSQSLIIRGHHFELCGRIVTRMTDCVSGP